MKTHTIVFDIDGVLADFVKGALDVARIIYPDAYVPKIGTREHLDWDTYPGCSATMVTGLWQFIAQHPEFWSELEPLATPAEFEMINGLLVDGHRVYFATSRRTPGALHATHAFLSRHIIRGVNTVIDLPLSIVTTHRKGEFCKVADANFFLDDKSENVDCVAWMTDGKTKGFVLDRLYNQGAKAPHSSKVKRVGSVEEFVKEVRK